MNANLCRRAAIFALFIAGSERDKIVRAASKEEDDKDRLWRSAAKNSGIFSSPASNEAGPTAVAVRDARESAEVEQSGLCVESSSSSWRPTAAAENSGVGA